MDQGQPPFADQLEELSALLMRMGGMCEDAIGNAVSALNDRDSVIAARVIQGDQEIDALELQIDSLCMDILVRQQPMARDLRLITTAMKITPDLERIADHAVNIAERALELNDEPPLPSIIRLFMNFVRTRSPYLASGRISRFSAA